MPSIVGVDEDRIAIGGRPSSLERNCLRGRFDQEDRTNGLSSAARARASFRSLRRARLPRSTGRPREVVAIRLLNTGKRGLRCRPSKKRPGSFTCSTPRLAEPEACSAGLALVAYPSSPSHLHEARAGPTWGNNAVDAAERHLQIRPGSQSCTGRCRHLHWVLRRRSCDGGDRTSEPRLLPLLDRVAEAEWQRGEARWQLIPLSAVVFLRITRDEQRWIELSKYRPRRGSRGLLWRAGIRTNRCVRTSRACPHLTSAPEQ
jgi:hypothetical protein